MLLTRKDEDTFHYLVALKHLTGHDSYVFGKKMNIYGFIIGEASVSTMEKVMCGIALV